MPLKEASAREFTREEVMQHGFPGDLWIIVHNQVFNVSEFCEEHPGGFEILLEFGGMDATDAFENKGHSRHAYSILTKFYIGEVVASQRIGDEPPQMISNEVVDSSLLKLTNFPFRASTCTLRRANG
ncbi:hypothetical protein L596_027774 [Steinernema carpocapsae]|uniref:Cytochrome b5 n=1 Tax=Steinernema carpocapsae TaxID=34508 RepID=A0A4U5LWJ6_STECR|nr:hypothetical protein L596_027774 [Steinernema carpocapsae]